MKILVCGMPRSMTTWIFNVIAALLKDSPEILWIAPDAENEAAFINNTSSIVLAKCHHFSPELAKSADIIIYSYRDLRGAAVSARRKFNSKCDQQEISRWLRAYSQWRPLSDLVVRYEWAMINTVAAIDALRTLLHDHSVLTVAVEAADIEEKVDALFVGAESELSRVQNSNTLIHSQHRTFSPPPEKLDFSEKKLYDEITAANQDWLDYHGYTDSGAAFAKIFIKRIEGYLGEIGQIFVHKSSEISNIDGNDAVIFAEVSGDINFEKIFSNGISKICVLCLKHDVSYSSEVLNFNKLINYAQKIGHAQHLMVDSNFGLLRMSDGLTHDRSFDDVYIFIISSRVNTYAQQAISAEFRKIVDEFQLRYLNELIYSTDYCDAENVRLNKIFQEQAAYIQVVCEQLVAKEKMIQELKLAYDATMQALNDKLA